MGHFMRNGAFTALEPYMSNLGKWDLRTIRCVKQQIPQRLRTVTVIFRKSYSNTICAIPDVNSADRSAPYTGLNQARDVGHVDAVTCRSCPIYIDRNLRDRRLLKDGSVCSTPDAM